MRNIFTLFLFFFVLSCGKSDDAESVDLRAQGQNACTTDAPLEITWVKELIKTMDCGKYSCRISLFQSKYEGQSVFYTAITDSLCNYQAHLFLYDCMGKLIKEMSNEESLAYLNNQYVETVEGKDHPIVLFSCNVNA